MPRVKTTQTFPDDTWAVAFSAADVGRAGVNDGERCRTITFTHLDDSSGDVRIIACPVHREPLASGLPGANDEGYRLTVAQKSVTFVCVNDAGVNTGAQFFVRREAAGAKVTWSVNAA